MSHHHHSQRIPATTQSNPRYWSTQNSFFSDASNATHNSFSKMHFASGVNQSFDSAFTGNNDTSMLHTKSRQIPSKNKWNHTFSIPIACGKSTERDRFEPSGLFCDPHYSRLQPANGRSIVCGGLKWDIYIHPNQGQHGNQFSLSVFPVKSHADDSIPPNYKLSYTVKTALNPSPNSHNSDDDQKAVSRFDHQWTREISEVVYDANPQQSLLSQSQAPSRALAVTSANGNMSGHSGGAAAGGANVDWKMMMERVPFSTEDLRRYNDNDDSGDFDLYVSIQTRFVKQAQGMHRTPYYGVVGAILLQTEGELASKEKHISDLENKRDELVQTLQAQLSAINASNTKLVQNNSQLSDAQQSLVNDLHGIRREIEGVSRRQQEQKERSAEEFEFQLEARQTEIERLKKQIEDLKEHSKQLLFQMANQQTLFDSQRGGFQQQWMQQNAQLLTPQHPSHLLSQHAAAAAAATHAHAHAHAHGHSHPMQPPPPQVQQQQQQHQQVNEVRAAVPAQARQAQLQSHAPPPLPPQSATSALSSSHSQTSNQLFATFTDPSPRKQQQLPQPQSQSNYRPRVLTQPNWNTYAQSHAPPPLPPQSATSALSSSHSQTSNQLFATFTDPSPRKQQQLPQPQSQSNYRPRVLTQPNWNTYAHTPSKLMPIADTEPNDAGSRATNELLMPSIATPASVSSAQNAVLSHAHAQPLTGATQREEHDEKETTLNDSELSAMNFTSLNIDQVTVALPQLEQVDQATPQQQQPQQQEEKIQSQVSQPEPQPPRQQQQQQQQQQQPMSAARSNASSASSASDSLLLYLAQYDQVTVALPQLEQVDQPTPQQQQEEKIQSQVSQPEAQQQQQQQQQPMSAASARSNASSASSASDSLLLSSTAAVAADKTTSSKSSPLPAVLRTISDEIDAEKEEKIFDASPCKAWRFDSEQRKWRARGRGNLRVYYHSEARMAKIVFMDTKHKKNRLLQWIESAQAAHLSEVDDAAATSNCVEWVANDYTMDVQQPMYGSWKLSFLEQQQKADEFVALFNKYLAMQQQPNNDDNENNVGGCPHVDDVRENQEDEKQETLMTGGDAPFSFSASTEAPKESFSAGMDFKFGSGTDWANAFGAGNQDQTQNAQQQQSTTTTTQVGSSFEDLSMWSFNTGQSDPATAGAGVETVANTAEKIASVAATAGSNETAAAATEEDNCQQITFKPIAADLKEQKVDTGHEQEEKLAEFEFLSLYRWGADVSGCKCWKKRATKSSIGFYECTQTRKIRMTAREEVTNKLRLNQLVSKPDVSRFMAKVGGKQTWQWFGYDTTIAAEEDDESAGFSQWCIRFKEEEAYKAFGEMYEKASAQNASVASPVKQQLHPVVDKIVEKQEASQADVGANGDAQVQDDEQQYKGWTEEEVALDKQRREKAKQDAQTAKLFGSGGGGGDAGNDGGASWNMDAFSTSKVGGDFGKLNFSFDENQRGVDLEAERELNRFGAPTNIQFGVDANAGAAAKHDEERVDGDAADAQDFSNVTTRDQGRQNGGDGGDGSAVGGGGGLGLENFSFVSQNEAASSKNEAQENVENTGVGGWGNFSGGFSSVQTTDGFANVQWGGGKDDATGFGSFGNLNENFSFGDLVSDKAQESETTATTTTTSAAENADRGSNGKDGDDNCQQITFKPIVELQEVDVESGHENEKHVGEFEVVKLYRWGKDVTSNPGWKTRASNTKIMFYQNAETGQVRIVCRENVTSKLSLNQLVTMNFGAIEQKTPKQLQWKAIDCTIAEEDDKEGFCMFAAKFKESETAEEFSNLWTKFAQNNAEING
eukprot:CAMPEP_0202726168 /NCGR_PEP_ID=MMETSP1385-20130828/184470_1 /ASSEMBLY_ACC=CAM_ASM_000861 /TAXON_ID=933848 /ORGANISM="Elphidium margaritaceum" /LENGTH=1792 /DNA_ID=CAMNT_0049392381 /DNA_START=175 /DNA_END=5554 /DNA_ORIENTATION=+